MREPSELKEIGPGLAIGRVKIFIPSCRRWSLRVLPSKYASCSRFEATVTTVVQAGAPSSENWTVVAPPANVDGRLSATVGAPQPPEAVAERAPALPGAVAA